MLPLRSGIRQRLRAYILIARHPLAVAPHRGVLHPCAPQQLLGRGAGRRWALVRAASHWRQRYPRIPQHPHRWASLSACRAHGGGGPCRRAGQASQPPCMGILRMPGVHFHREPASGVCISPSSSRSEGSDSSCARCACSASSGACCSATASACARDWVRGWRAWCVLRNSGARPRACTRRVMGGGSPAPLRSPARRRAPAHGAACPPGAAPHYSWRCSSGYVMFTRCHAPGSSFRAPDRQPRSRIAKLPLLLEA